MIYLASPIDLTEGREVTMRQMARAALERHGLAYYDPATRPFGNAKADPVTAYAINDFALSECEGLLACLPDHVQTIGTPMEIAKAHQEEIPIAVVRPTGSSWSMQLEGMGIRTFTTPELAVAWLVDEIARRERVSRVMGRIQRLPRVLHGELLRGQVLDLDSDLDNVEELHAVEPPVLRWIGDRELAPTQTYDGDAAWDLYVARDTTVHANQFVDVDLGIRIELPEGVWAMLTGRSSTLRKRKLLVTQGIIDNGYRGPLYAGVQSLGEKVHLKRGERIAQLIPFNLEARGIAVERVDELSDSERGSNGFGSTGA